MLSSILLYFKTNQPDENIDGSLPNMAVKPIAATVSSYEKNPIYTYQAGSAIDSSIDALSMTPIY